MYVCACKELKEQDLQRAARGGSGTAEALIRALHLDDPGCCGRCVRRIDELVALSQGQPSRLRLLPFMPRLRRPPIRTA